MDHDRSNELSLSVLYQEVQAFRLNGGCESADCGTGKRKASEDATAGLPAAMSLTFAESDRPVKPLRQQK